MRTSNPALRAETFQGYRYATGQGVMTVNGAVNKTGILAVLLFAAAVYSWGQSTVIPGQVTLSPLTWVGLFGGLIVAMVTVFKHSWSPITAPLYAVLEGLFLGGISALFESRFPGIAFQAILLTIGTLTAMLVAYRIGLIRVSNNFIRGVAAATGGVFLIYMASWILGIFGVSIPYIHGSGMIGIGFSLVVIVIAALNLVLDFHLIEEGANRGAPKFMEWYAAFSLLVTLVWLYFEILRLLAKLQSRD